MKREAEAGAMTGSGGPTSPHKRYRQGDDELRLLIPSKVSRSIRRGIAKLSFETRYNSRQVLGGNFICIKYSDKI